MSTFPANPDLRTEEFELKMGPQHPSTHGVLQLSVTLDGERVVACKPNIGFLHRSIEKMMENRTYAQCVPLADRVDYCSAMTASLAYVMAVEKLLDLTIPPRAEYLRVVMSELNRIASHFIAYGTFALDMGGTTPFLFAFRDREAILDLFEEVSGGRLLYNYMRIGGVARDVAPDFMERVIQFLDYWEPLLASEYEAILDKNPIFYNRTKGVGVLPQDLALRLGVCGPNLRAAGVPYDVRKAHPYAAYPQLEFDIPCHQESDNFARYRVRMEEFRQSARILRQCAEKMPKGEVLVRQPYTLKVPEGETYVHIESSRGDLGCYLVSDGSDKPYRCKFRTPSFAHCNAFQHIVKDCLFSDIVSICASFDIVLPEADR